MSLARAKTLIQNLKFEEAIKEIDILNNDEILDGLILKSQIHRMEGDNKKALIFAEKALENENVDKFPIKKLNALLAKNYALLRLGKLKEIESVSINFKKIINSEIDIEETGLDDLNSTYCHVMGMVYSAKGEIDYAIKETEKSLKIRRKLGLVSDIAYSLNNLGWYYYLRGDLGYSLKYHNEALKIREGIGNKLLITYSLNNIGAIYREEGKKEKALTIFKKALKNAKKLNDQLLNSRILLQLIEINLEMKIEKEAKNCLNELKEIKQNSKNTWINSVYRLSEALLLKSSGRLKQKALALEKLEEIVNEFDDEEIIVNALKNPCRESTIDEKNSANDPDLIIRAIKHLSELYLLELKTTDENPEDILNQCKDLISKLYNIGENTHFFSVVVECLILQAKFALLEGRFNEVPNLLEKAKKLTNEKGLNRLKLLVEQQELSIENDIQKLSTLIDLEASMFEKIKQIELETYIKDALKMTRSMN